MRCLFKFFSFCKILYNIIIIETITEIITNILKRMVVKLFKRILIQFTGNEEVEPLVRYAKLITKEYTDFEIVGLYIKDIEKYDMPTIPVNKDHMILPSSDEWNFFEDKRGHTIKESFKSLMPNSDFYLKTGRSAEVILEELRLFDLLILAKPDKITQETKEILKNHHKPIILVPFLDEYSFEKPLIADDQRLEVNKAFFNFMNIFTNMKEFTSISVNVEEKDVIDLNVYLAKTDKKLTYEFKTGHIDGVILEELKNYDLLIMGEMKYSFIYERIVGKSGLKLLEEITKPIFIS